MNIYEKMLAIQTEMQTVAKNLEVETGKGRGYKAVSERDIIDAVKPLEAKYKVYSYPVNREVIHDEILESETVYKDQVTKKSTFFSRIRTTYRFVNVEKPEEYIETVTLAEGIDSQDKGSGKAMTYADKYALMKSYKISTGDDPDEKASEETEYFKNGELASAAEKRSFMDTCAAMGLEYEKILLKTGWERGDKLTKDQLGKALVIMRNISNEK